MRSSGFVGIDSTTGFRGYTYPPSSRPWTAASFLGSHFRALLGMNGLQHQGKPFTLVLSTCQVYFDQRCLDGIFTTPVMLNNGGLKGLSAQFGHIECYFTHFGMQESFIAPNLGTHPIRLALAALCSAHSIGLSESSIGFRVSSTVPGTGSPR